MLAASVTPRHVIEGKPAQTGKIKRLTAAKIAEKRSKNLCFWCDECYLPGHQCPKKYLHSIMVQESDEDDENLRVEDDVPLISLHAINSLENNRISTMRLVGFYKKRKIHMLVDSGSTYNVLDLALAKNLGCKLITLLTPLVITVTSGQTIICEYECDKFSWEMQGGKFTVDFLVMTLGGCELVLGVQWLSTLGKIEWNFKALNMSFELEGVKYELVGCDSIMVKLITNQGMERLMKQGQKAYLAHISVKGEGDGSLHEIPMELEPLLLEY